MLAKLGKLTPPGVGEEPASTTRLGDWYANRLNLGRTRMILCTSERSLLSVIVPAKDLPGLPGRLADALAYLLDQIGVPDAAITRELREMQWVRFAPTASRRVLGHMNDFAFSVEHRASLGEGPLYMSDLAEQLAGTPCGSMDYARPRDVAADLLRSAR